MPTCEICEHEVKTERGLKAHKTQKHSEHSGKYTYECEWCGDEFEANRSPDSKHAPKYCPSDDGEKGCYAKSLEGDNNPNKDPERKKKISETMKKNYEEGSTQHSERDSDWMMENVVNKRDDSYLHEEPSDETKKKLSKVHKRIAEEGEHHLQDPDIREKIVKTRNENDEWEWYPDIDPEKAQELSVEAREVFGPKIIEVEETGNTVDSTWEAEIDRLLHSLDIEYYYNDGDELNKFVMENGNYVPDFIIPKSSGDIVIEVKGWLGYGYNKEKSEKFAKEMTEREDVEYVIYGDVELECDEYIEYGNEEKLKEIFQ